MTHSREDGRIMGEWAAKGREDETIEFVDESKPSLTDLPEGAESRKQKEKTTDKEEKNPILLALLTGDDTRRE